MAFLKALGRLRAAKKRTKSLKKKIKQRKADVSVVRTLARGGGTLSQSRRAAEIKAEPRPLRRDQFGNIVSARRRKR